MGIHVVNPLAGRDWDELVGELPGATFFHGAAWARVLHDTYGYSPAYFAAFARGRLQAMLPCMEVDTFAGSRRGVCLPFSDRVFPVGEGGSQARDLFESLNAHGRQRAWRTWEVRGGFDELPGAVSSIEYHRHVLDLTPGPAALFCGFDPAVRRALRKAERSGIEVRGGHSIEAMTAFYVLHCRTRRKHGLPPQPWAFFENIRRHVLAEGQGRLVLGYHGHRAVAGAIFFHWGKEVLYKFGASDEVYLDLRPNNHVLWHGIELYAFDGFERFDLGRTSLSNTGLRRYKLGWGACETRLAYHKYDLRRMAFVVASDATEGWPKALLRMLPLAVLRLIGARLYRHLA